MSQKTRILVTDGLAANGADLLKAESRFQLDLRKATPVEELESIIGGYECIVIRSATRLTKELIDRATSMKLIVRAGAGVDNIDVKAATARGIPVMNTASANSMAAAEQTLALMFAMLRQTAEAARSLREGRWDRETFKGYEAHGRTLGVVGLGNIGRIVAEKAVGLGMKVLGYDPMIQTAGQLKGRLAQMDESVSVARTVDEVFKSADIVSVHIPKTDQTKNLVNAARLATMKKGAFLINCARGGVVDENAVVAAVNDGQLAGAAFDVFEKEPPADFSHPMFKHPKITCTPHLGASTFEAQERVASTAAKQILAFFATGDRTGVVNP